MSETYIIMNGMDRVDTQKLFSHQNQGTSIKIKLVCAVLS